MAQQVARAVADHSVPGTGDFVVHPEAGIASPCSLTCSFTMIMAAPDIRMRICSARTHSCCTTVKRCWHSCVIASASCSRPVGRLLALKRGSCPAALAVAVEAAVGLTPDAIVDSLKDLPWVRVAGQC